MSNCPMGCRIFERIPLELFAWPLPWPKVAHKNDVQIFQEFFASENVKHTRRLRAKLNAGFFGQFILWKV